MAEGNEERSKRDEQEEQWQKQKQRWEEADERWARLEEDTRALLKIVQERVRRKEEGGTGADA